MDPVRIGLIGCGTISGAYLRAAATFDILRFVGCADIDASAAGRTQERFGVPAMSVDELLERDDVEVILNLTIPAAHGAVNLAALEAGKHAYCEKPFGLDVAEGQRVLAAADAAGLRVGCAPDTFLGGARPQRQHQRPG
ncbi:MAG: Gfo/Idh/MocA family oxidoreductase, partial [Gammaproteobacteria bacterium]|nr:Gfo/Idh/MocA family oxidoreductase [Gammaproteobacteria bacterium]